MIGRLLAVFAAIALLGLPSTDARNAADAMPGFAPGQLWSLKSTPPTTAKIVVGRIEDRNGRIVVHVSIVDVPVPKTIPAPNGTMIIAHLPFDRSALAGSVDRLLATKAKPAPDFESGYGNWKNAQGGVFTISVPQAIDFVIKSMERTAAKPN